MTTPTQADPPRRALPRRQQHHRVERPGGPAATSSSARSRTSPRPPSGPSSTSSSWPRGCGCASRAGRSTTSTSSAGRTRSPCWPRWPRSPTDLGLAGTINSTFNEPYEVARQFATPRPPLRRPGRVERGHLLGRVHRRELPPRRLPRRRTSATRGPSSSCAPPGSCSTPGTATRSSPTRTPASSSPTRRRARSPTTTTHFDIAGQFNVPRSPQGRPVIFQAGDSDEGREFAAATRRRDLHPARHARGGPGVLRRRQGPAGPATAARRDDLLILPAATFVLGDTDAEAAEQAARGPPAAGQRADRDQVPRAAVEPRPVRLRPGRPAAGRSTRIVGENTIARGRASVRMHRDPLATAQRVARAGRGRRTCPSAS